jgi:hypothetical protein
VTILYRHEVCTSITEPLPLARYPGTLLFTINFTLSDAGLLITSGRLLLRHSGIDLGSPYGREYAIYAHARGVLDDQEIFLDGQNIVGHEDHYYAANLAYQKPIAAGSHVLKLYASSGSDADDNADGLGDLHYYNGANVNQFNVLVLA